MESDVTAHPQQSASAVCDAVESDVTAHLQQSASAVCDASVVDDINTDLVAVSVIGVRLVAQEPVDGYIPCRMEVDQNSTEVVETYIPACIVDRSKDDNAENVLEYLRRSGVLIESGALVSNQALTEASHTASYAAVSESVSSSSKVRKRKRNPEAHKKSKKMRLSNTGQQYVSGSGQTVEARTLGPRLQLP